MKVANLAAARELHFARTRIEARHTGLEAQVDAALGVKAVGPQRHPLFRRVARKIILGEIGTVDRGGIVVAEHRDAAAIVVAPKHLGCREPGRPTADDHDPVRHLARRLAPRSRLGVGALGRHEDLAVALFDRPAVDRTKRRGVQCLTSAQAEAGVMPRAANRIADHQAFGQRPVIVTAFGADREDFAALPRQQHLFLADMADKHGAIGKVSRRNAFCQIGAAGLGLVFSHVVLHR